MATERCGDMFRRYFAAMGASDGETMAEFMTPAVRWWFPPSASQRATAEHSVTRLLGHVPERPEVGRDAVLAVVGHVDHFYQSLEYTLNHIVEDDDMVAVHATAHGVTAIGRDYENEYHILFRLEDGRIAEVWEFLDTAFVYARNT
jgi:ketosteroid isomerase-like protein